MPALLVIRDTGAWEEVEERRERERTSPLPLFKREEKERESVCGDAGATKKKKSTRAYTISDVSDVSCRR